MMGVDNEHKGDIILYRYYVSNLFTGFKIAIITA